MPCFGQFAVLQQYEQQDGGIGVGKRACLGDVGAREHQATGGGVLFHGPPQAVLRLAAQPVHLVQDQDLEAALALDIQGPALGHLLCGSGTRDVTTVWLSVGDPL